MRLWVADGERGLMLADGRGWRAAGPPGRLLCRAEGCIFCAGESACFCCDDAGHALRRFAIPSGACAMEAAGGRVYLLSSDADSLSAWDAKTGALILSAPAGVYPRGLAVRPDGRLLAAAGGAAGEILLFGADLRLLKTYRVPGVAVGVCFLPQGLAALCAVGDGEVSGALLRISPRGVVKTLFSCPETPCRLCATREGCAAGCYGRVYFFGGQGRLLRAVSCACPEGLRACGEWTLIADPWEGRVTLEDGTCVYQGASPDDALLAGP